MEPFVENNSIVRKIWGKGDTVLFIFAGAAAEFALNKAVDWLYFTGKLPSDPLGRLFSTVKYSKDIIFSSQHDAEKSISIIRQIHKTVENNRGTSIPDWAYRDVLFMLIDYSIASFELLERKLTAIEKEEIYCVFLKVGTLMGISELPPSYIAWLPVRKINLAENLKPSKFTFDLFKQYKKHLGTTRYFFLIEAQKLVVPKQIKKLLYLNDYSVLLPAIPIYKFSRIIKIDSILKNMMLPPDYKKEIKELDVAG